MRTFTLEPGMLSMGGQFYPTGHIVAMFPTEDAARAAAKDLARAGCAEDAILWLPPAVLLQEVVRTVGNADIPLPSAGTEADTTRRYAELAAQGHHGLVIASPDDEHAPGVLQALQAHQPSYAQKYRMLVIEDIVE